MDLGRVYGRWRMINENTNNSGVSGRMPAVLMKITGYTYPHDGVGGIKGKYIMLLTMV